MRIRPITVVLSYLTKDIIQSAAYNVSLAVFNAGYEQKAADGSSPEESVGSRQNVNVKTHCTSSNDTTFFFIGNNSRSYFFSFKQFLMNMEKTFRVETFNYYKYINTVNRM